MTSLDFKKPATAPPVPPMNSTSGAIGSLSGGFSGSTASKQPREVKTLELKDHVGFDSLPDQLVRKAKTNGFTFNVLCVGETGIGKSTLVESLFNMPLDFQPCSYELKTVELRSKTYDINESGVRLTLTIVETAGFGDQLDKEGSAKVIVDYINKSFEHYLQEELKVRRQLPLFKDTRIHACLYFISPTGHGLKALDVVTMKELCKRVNVIPVIAKADTTSKEELKRFKAKILTELKASGIETYRFPEDDETIRQINAPLNASVPFAVVGSTDFVKKNGKQVRARQYPWGIVEVENEDHCDFVKLREALLRQNVEDLREKTHGFLYEHYRRNRLNEMGIKDGETGPGLAQAFQEKAQSHRDELARKEAEMKEKFVTRVREKEQEIKTREEQIRQRFLEQKRCHDEDVRFLDDEIAKADQELAYMEQKKLQATSTGKKKKGHHM